MKNFFILSSFVIFCALLSSCAKPSKGPVTINLDEAGKTRTVKLSELASNLKCVPLESKENVIIPDDQTRIWAGEKYIIALNNKDIQQFTADGKYIRKLASAGKGPNEFTYIIPFAVDETSSRLYYGHQGDWYHISVIDLTTGEHLPKLKVNILPFDMDIKDGNILYTPFNRGNSFPTVLYTINPAGELIDSVRNPNTSVMSNFLNGNAQLLPVKQNGIHLQMQDTVYNLHNSGLESLFVFDYGNKFHPETNLKGMSKAILAETSDHFLIRMEDIDMQKSDNGGIMVTLRPSHTRWVDKKSLEIDEMEKFYIDPLDIHKEISYSSLLVKNRKVIYKLSAFSIKEIAEQKAEAGETLSPLLKQLNEQLTEEDNPVLIIGDLK